MNATCTHLILTTSFAVALLVSSSQTVQAEEDGYTALASVDEGCSVQFKIEKPPGLYTIMFHGRPYPLADITSDLSIDLDEVLLFGKFVRYLAEPAINRPKLAITQIINGETLVKPIHYDDEALSQALNDCFTTDAYTPPEVVEQSDSRFARIPELPQLRQQATDLDVDIADFYHCQCGQAFSAVEMESPPWRDEALVLETGADACILRSEQAEGMEYVRAGGSSDIDQTSCAALLGMHTRYRRSNFQPKLLPKYNQTTQQACYNIIVAKAQQWLSNGHNLKVLNVESGTTEKASEKNISCVAR